MTVLSRRDRRERESSRRPDGHQGSPRGERRGPGTLGAGHEAGVPAAGGRRGESVLAGLAPPALTRDAYTLDQFVGELVAPSGVLRPVQGPQAPGAVHRRRLYVGGHRRPGGGRRPPAPSRSSRRIASAVVAAVASVGLGGTINTSYPRGLRALLDDAPERYAVIDVGTNSVKLHVGERGAAGAWRAIVDRAEVTRLGEGLEERRDRARSSRADRERDRGHERTRRSATGCWRSSLSARPACGSPATARRSSTRSGRERAFRSR